MAVVNKEEENVDKKADETKTYKYYIRPTRYINYDSDKKEWEIEVHLPGIKKENIDLRVLKDMYVLRATRDQALYALTENFPFDVKVESVQGEYKDGLLRVKGSILDPMENAIEIKL